MAPGRGSKRSTAAGLRPTPASRQASTSAAVRSPPSTMWAKGSPASRSPAKVRKTGRTGSCSRESVITMSRIGCAAGATRSQTPRAPSMRRAAAAIA